MKLLFGVYVALAVVAASGAVSAADPGRDEASSEASNAAQASCPHLPVAIYFGEGETSASREAEELLVRAGRTAVDCKPFRIDLIAHVDPNEGEAALRLALGRLNVVSRELAAQGLPPLDIRVATEDVASNPGGGVTGRQVDIHFRTFAAPTGADNDRRAPVAPTDHDLPSAI